MKIPFIFVGLILLITAVAIPVHILWTECLFPHPRWMYQLQSWDERLCLGSALRVAATTYGHIFIPALAGAMLCFVGTLHERRRQRPAPSHSLRPAERTSVAQLIWMGRLIAYFGRGIGSHLRRFAGIYGFIAGSLTTLLTLAAWIWFGLFAFPLPWKVTNPADPRFRPQNFHFADYQNSNELSYALPLIVPIGTPKPEVDKILGHKGVRIIPVDYIRTADTGVHKYKYIYRNYRSIFMEFYTMSPVGEHSWSVVATYDDKGNLIKFF